MKIRDIKPGQFFTCDRFNILWLKMNSNSLDECVAMVVDNAYKGPNGMGALMYGIAKWPVDFIDDIYEIIPPEDV